MVLPAGEVQCVTHAVILVVMLQLKYLETYPDGSRLCTGVDTEDGPVFTENEELEMKGIFLSRVLGVPAMPHPWVVCTMPFLC